MNLDIIHEASQLPTDQERMPSSITECEPLSSTVCLQKKEGSVSRDEAIAVVEAYLNGLAKKNLTNVPFAADITFEGPRVPKLIGRERVVGFLTSIMPLVTRIEIKQHLVDGEFVATMF